MKIFVSSTYCDLIEHRLAVIETLLHLRVQPIAMEYFGADPREPKQVCAEEIRDSDGFIGIYAHRYGSIPEGDEKSITEQEYNLARELDKPCFCYIIDRKHPWLPEMIEEEPGKSKLVTFKSRLDKAVVRDTFTTPDKLAAKVGTRLGRWLLDRGQPVPRFLPGLLTPDEFAKRAEQAALGSHTGAIVGRQQILEEMAGLLASSSRVIVLHGPGGVGKTRLLLALPDIVPDGTRLWYTRTEAETIEGDLAALDSQESHIVVVDDAHRFGPLFHLRELLVNPDFARRTRLVLATRSVFSEPVGFRFSPMPGDQISEIEIAPLGNAEIDRLLQNPPQEIEDKRVRRTLVAIAEGNPLIAQVSAKLVQPGASIADLTRDEILTRYLDELIHDLAEAGYGEQYIAYLEVLAALNTLDLDNERLRQRAQQVVGISQADEERIVTGLVRTGLVERYWMTLRIASEVMADHILISHFFDPQTKRVDYQSQIIEPFLPLRPKQILTNLAEAEIKGESREAGLLLGSKLDELHRLVDEGGNIARFNILEWLEDVAYLRPDETIAIVARIVDGPELPPDPHYHPPWPSYEIDHGMVLQQAVDIIRHTIYRGSLRTAVTYLFKLVRYHPTIAEYDRVRKDATKALVDIAELAPGKPYGVQLTLLELIPDWLAQDFAGNLELVLALLQPMLRMSFHATESDPTERSRIIMRQGLLEPTEPLRHIRQRTFESLYEAYEAATTVAQRVRVVQIIGETFPYSPPNVMIPDETMDWLEVDCSSSARFFSEAVIPTAALPILDVVSKWLWRAKRWYKNVDDLARLEAQLDSRELYQLYRVLVGWHRWEDEKPDWRKTKQRRQEAVESYVERLSEETFEQSLSDLDTIATQAREAGEVGRIGTQWFSYLLQTLGEQHPGLARELVQRSVNRDLALKHHLSSVLVGLRQSAPDVSWAYIESWTAGSDQVLWLAVARSYHFADWEALQDAEWNILRQLIGHNSPQVALLIIWLTHDFAPHNPELAVGLLKTLADQGDENILQRVAEVLSWPNDTRTGWAVEFADSQDYLDIVQNFERLPSLDYHVEECLNRMGDIAPMKVIDFFERRISAVRERREEGERYNAVPFEPSRAMDTIRTCPQCLDVLRHVRNWMLQEDILFRVEAPRVLKGIAEGLDSPLYEVLMEWVDSGEEEKLQAIADILQGFNEGDAFYSLCREIVSRTDSEGILGTIGGVISSTPGVISGGLSRFYRGRLEDITSWQEDNSLRVRRFARRMVDSLQRAIEREEAWEELEKKNW